jgi:hypothetical protein
MMPVIAVSIVRQALGIVSEVCETGRIELFDMTRVLVGHPLRGVCENSMIEITQGTSTGWRPPK